MARNGYQFIVVSIRVFGTILWDTTVNVKGPCGHVLGFLFQFQQTPDDAQPGVGAIMNIRALFLVFGAAWGIVLEGGSGRD